MSPETLKKTQRTEITNFMEELAEDILKDLLSEEKKGRFSKNAVQDIKALALNRLWPMYLTTNTGRDFLEKVVVEDRIEQDIVRELKAAINIVRSNPRE